MAVRDVVQAAAGVGGGSEYVEDVFSTYLYTGDGSTQTITNGIDLAGEGGLVWIKTRNASSNSVTNNHYWQDSERLNFDAYIASNTTAAQNAFNRIDVSNNGFSTVVSNLHESGINYASWTFRKAPKFFDVVTYTGNNEVAQYVNHNLGVTPAVIILKSLDSAGSWYVWHKDLTSASHSLRLNTTSAEDVDSNYEIGINASDTQIYIDTGSDINYQGNYVAYLFAHDAGGFGDDGEQNVISCGSYTTDGSASAQHINLGFEPQWFMVKKASNTGNWEIYDNMRGWSAPNDTYGVSSASRLYANLNVAEGATTSSPGPTATGMYFPDGGQSTNSTYIYIAIRRPMKTPESGTEVFAVNAGTSTGVTSSFTTDLVFPAGGITGDTNNIGSRLQGGQAMNSYNTGLEQDFSSNFVWDRQTGWGTNVASFYAWMFKRAPGFMDVVAYTGTGSARTVNHNLGVAPEMIVLKHRNGADNWVVGHKEFNWLGPVYLNESYGYIGDNIAWWNNTAPTSTEFTIGFSGASNTNTGTYIAYLFATLPGVSKVGSYTGTGADLNVDCGFSAGARFILIKQTDGNGNWCYWDSVRGITTGNDPFLRYNSSAGQQTGTDLVEPLPSGFIVTGNGSDPAWDQTNKLNSTYIFLAIA